MVRIWEQSAEDLLAGPFATLPLAPLVGVPDTDMSAVMRRIEARVREEAETAPDRAERVRTGTYLLLGLRFQQDLIDALLQGVGIMAGALKESSTYQKILNEGLVEGEARGLERGARELLITAGSARLGPPDQATRAALEQISDTNRLAELTVRLFDATSWDDLGLDRDIP